MLTGGGGGGEICQNLADVICERSLTFHIKLVLFKNIDICPI